MITKDQAGISIGQHLFSAIKLQQKSLFLLILQTSINLIPFIMAKPRNGLPKLGSNQSKRILNIITILMKRFRPKIMIRSPKQ